MCSLILKYMSFCSWTVSSLVSLTWLSKISQDPEYKRICTFGNLGSGFVLEFVEVTVSNLEEEDDVSGHSSN